MSLASRIIFVSCMMACAALCAWAAVSFGGPATTPMWIISGVCVLVAVVAWFIKAPAPTTLDNVRVEGAREPTFRLVRTDKGAKGEIWQLVLGKTQCTLIRPDGTHATTFARKWADTAIKLPGFVAGKMLGIVTEEWTPPDEERWLTKDALFQAAKSIRRASDRDVPCYWFSPSEEVTAEIEEYERRTLLELGPEAAGPLLIKARQCTLSGAIGLGVGIVILGIWLMQPSAQAGGPAKSGSKMLGLGAVISVIGLWRIGQGIALRHESRASGMSTARRRQGTPYVLFKFVDEAPAQPALALGSPGGSPFPNRPKAFSGVCRSGNASYRRLRRQTSYPRP